MTKYFKNFISVFTGISLCYLFTSCANIGTITGGDKDTIPPVMVKSKPVILDTSYNDDKVIIYFNEYFSLKDPNQEFLSSPPFKEIPDFKIKKKGLTVKFNEPLKDSVTYSLNFGNAIVDYNEGNILENYRFIFSTKSNIDSFAISGNLRKAIDGTVPEKSLVMIFENIEDSIPYKSLPSYLCNTDTSGNFNIDFIKPGTYKIFALNDKNSNKMADIFEEHAFLDSLIIPKRKTFIKTDSIKAGTVLHDIDSDRKDSVINDTLIITHQSITTPSNLQLYLFAEDNLQQKVLDFTRKEKGKLMVIFQLPVTPDFIIKPVNFQIDPENVIVEKNLRQDTVTWWLTDSIINKKDSLQASVSYLSKDTLGSPIVAIDTMIFEYREKQEKDAWKRKPKESQAPKKEYLKLEYLAKANKVDLNRPFVIESPTPLLTVDTSKIRLFEIVDTSVIDIKEQKIIKTLRLQRDILTFKFKRPIAEEFFLIPLNFGSNEWYTSLSSDSNRVYTCKITDPDVASIDTLKLRVEFDNHFFLNQIQALSDTAILPITENKILNRKRFEPDKIMLVFNKPLNSKLSVSPVDFNATPGWYNISNFASQDSVIINLFDKNVSAKDTMTLAVKTFDYINLNGDSIFFTETMRLTYKEKAQFLVSSARIKKDEIKLVFNKRNIKNPTLQPINFTSNLDWFRLNVNKEGDTLIYKIIDNSILEKDSINLVIKYKDINRKGQTIDFADTIKLKSGATIQLKKRTDSEQVVEKEGIKQKVSIYLPTNYIIKTDSLNIRQRLLDVKWKEEKKYLLRLDSIAFNSVFNLFNPSEDFNFTTPPLNYYSIIDLTLKNTKPSIQSMASKEKADSLNNDTSINSFKTITQKEIDDLIGKGAIILQLLNEKDIIIREYSISKDQIVKMDFLSPGNYKIKIIFDKNGNGKWDTGDYFKHLQPERVLMNGEKIILKEDTELKLEWNVGESLVKTFTKVTL